MDLSNIDPSTIDSLLDEIDENEMQFISNSKLDSWIRNLWKIGSFVEIYSNSSHSWYKGTIINITNKDNGWTEILEIKYIDNMKKTHLKHASRDDMDELRPFSIAMPIYKYIFNAINTDDDDTTPIISDLDDLYDSSVDELNDNDSNNTPEPLDTPPPPPYGCNISINYDDEEMKIEAVGKELPVLSHHSRSLGHIQDKKGYWQQKTMTRWKRSSSIIKCITPITQKMAEMKINSYYERRRSVANIDHSVHKLFKLDPDLLKIREEYLLRSDENNDVLV